MNLVIDIGNTLTKVAVFSDDEIVQNVVVEALSIDLIDRLLMELPAINNGILSSVRDRDIQKLSLLQKKLFFFIELDGDTPIPIENLYKTKSTLGKDRIAGVVGANNIFPEKNVLLVDAGTAITFDFINNHKQYIGGNISPGLKMRFMALNSFTKKLPLVSRSDDFLFFGNTTESAIIAGVQNGIIFEVDSYIDKMNEKYCDIQTIITGGDCFFFDKKLKNVIFVVPDLILSGLNEILKFNVKNA